MEFARTLELLDPTRGLPTTAEDIEALRRLRGQPPMTLEEYFRSCESFAQPTCVQLATRRGPRGEPFSLPSTPGEVQTSRR